MDVKSKVAFLSHLDLNLYLFRLSWMKALMRRGFEVYAVVPRGDYADKLTAQSIKVIPYPIDRESLNPLKEIKIIYSLYKIFKKERFDLIHTFTIKPNIYGTIAGKLAGVPIIINTVTGLGYIYTIDNAMTKLLRIVLNLLYRICFKFAKKVIFQNTDDLCRLRNFLDSDNKALVIKGTGIDTVYFSPEEVDEKQVKHIKDEFGLDGKLVITMIARLYWSKGVKEFIEAANELLKENKNLIFLIIGWIDEGNPDAISEEFIQTNQNTFIKFLRKREDIREILYHTDVYVLPSYREGLPRTILEAMCMEKPIVTTNVPGCREVVENGINGFLVPAKNSKSLASAIEKLILDKEIREKMGRAGREKVIKEFSSEIIVDKIIKLYEVLSYEKANSKNN